MERFGFVGLPELASSLYNARRRRGARRALCLSPPPTPTSGWPRCSDRRFDRLAAMSNSKKVVPASVQFVGDRRPRSRAPARGGSATSSSPTSARSTRWCTCCGPSRTPTCPACPTRSSACGCWRSSWRWRTSRPSRAGVEKRRKAAKQDKSLTELVEALDAAHVLLAEGTPIYRGSLTDAEREVPKEEPSSPTSRCWRWSTWARAISTASPSSSPRWRLSSAGGPR